MEKIKIEKFLKTTTVMDTKMLDACPENIDYLVRKINELIDEVNNLRQASVRWQSEQLIKTFSSDGK